MIRLALKFVVYGLAVVGALCLVAAAASYLGFWAGAII
jgi:hypothetical protein